MEGALLAVAVLACPVGMGLMMWMMMRNDGKGGESRTTQADYGDETASLADKEVAELRAEIELLKAERLRKTIRGG